jgi:E3 ubiquitin-protein ligase HUWE1
MSEGEDDDEEVNEEMDAIINGHGYNSDDMDEDDPHLLDENEEEEEDGREMTWHLEDIDEDSGLVHDPLTENGDVNIDQTNGQRMSEQFEEVSFN